MKIKHTDVLIIHIILTVFAEKKNFYWVKRKENNWTDFLGGNKIIELCITDKVYVYVYLTIIFM